MIIVLILAVLLVVAAVRISREDDFESTHVFFSIVFMLLFYCLPAITALSSDQYFYLFTRYGLDTRTVYLVVGAFVVFLAGFFLKDMPGFKDVFTRRIAPEPVVSTHIAWQSLIAMIFLLSAMSIYFIATDSLSYSAMVRSGQLGGSWAFALLLYASQAMAVLCAVAAERLRITWLMMAAIAVVLVMALMLGGRALLLFSVAIIPAAFGVSVKRIALVGVILLPLFIPLIADGKFLLYMLTTGQSVEGYNYLERITSVQDVFSLYYDTIMNNFGHPFVSLANIDGVLEMVGYRYFYDVFQGILFYFSLIGLEAGDSLTYYNTQNLLGRKSSTIPTGYLAFGYVQASLLGVFVMGFVYRMIGPLVWWVIDGQSKGSRVLTTYVAIMTGYSFYTGEVRTMLLVIGWPVLCMAVFSPFFFVRPSRNRASKRASRSRRVARESRR